MTEQTNSDEPSRIEVTFVHPASSARTFEAKLSPECTGQMAIEGLLAGDTHGPFLDRAPSHRPYELQVMRTSQTILPSATFGQAGVVNGDVIVVRQAGLGAGFDFSEIAEILMTSGVTLAALKGLLQIVVKLIENEGNKSVIIRYRDGAKETEVTLQGSVADLQQAVNQVKKLEGDFQIEVTSNESSSPSKRPLADLPDSEQQQD